MDGKRVLCETSSNIKKWRSGSGSPVRVRIRDNGFVITEPLLSLVSTHNCS